MTLVEGWDGDVRYGQLVKSRVEEKKKERVKLEPGWSFILGRNDKELGESQKAKVRRRGSRRRKYERPARWIG